MEQMLGQPPIGWLPIIPGSAPEPARSCGARSVFRIVGGLIVSQILTLYTTPVVYLFLDN